jgi:hypothetical protein
MNTLLFLLVLLSAQVQMPKNDPNGVWEATTGTKFQLAVSGKDVDVRIVPGTSSTFIEYEMKLKGTDEPNTYQGSGFFVAKRETKQCKFETNWTIVVVTPDRIVGKADDITPDFNNCTVKDRGSLQLDLTKKPQ